MSNSRRQLLLRFIVKQMLMRWNGIMRGQWYVVWVRKFRMVMMHVLWMWKYGMFVSLCLMMVFIVVCV